MNGSLSLHHDGADELITVLAREHASELLRFARRFSFCGDDAQDALQRSMEILVRRMRREPPEQPLRWLRTVLRHEALAVRAQREQLLAGRQLDDARDQDRAAVDPADRVESLERLEQVATALRGLKPQERIALALRAGGLTYNEICERTSWTYTRCNRAVTEGRRALRGQLNAIPTEC